MGLDPDSTYLIMSVWPIKNRPIKLTRPAWAVFKTAEEEIAIIMS